MATYNPTTVLKVKDGDGVSTDLAATADAQWGKVPFHGIYGTVPITASSGEPVYVVGSVGVNNFPASQTVTASLINRVGVTGTVEINNFPSTQNVSATSANPVNQVAAYGTSILTGTINTVNWLDTAVGSFKICDSDSSRRELIIHNSGPGNLYIKLSTGSPTQTTQYGFGSSLIKDKVPTNYSFVVYPSGTYMTSEASRVLFHAGFFVSSSTPLTGTVQVTSIS